MSNFFISVIVPVYNGESFLAETIQSIIEQDCHPLEIILVDDGSTDKTAEVADQFKDVIHYVYQPNSGPATARNRGIKMAIGNVIAFLDADDCWPVNALKKQLDYLVANPDVEIVHGYLQNMYLSTDTEKKTLVKKFGKPRVSFNVGSAVYRKSVFDKIGLFDETLHHSEDVELLVRVKENGISWVILEHVTLFYRRHKQSMTSVHNENTLSNMHALSWVRILKKNLDKRRQKSNDLVVP